jgi:hypothetical protein
VITIVPATAMPFRFDDNAPLYRQVFRGDLLLRLSEHHGDGSPGARLRVTMRGVEAVQKELVAKDYRYMRPGLEKHPGTHSKPALSARSETSYASASQSWILWRNDRFESRAATAR